MSDLRNWILICLRSVQINSLMINGIALVQQYGE